jgi:hypothetical protein
VDKYELENAGITGEDNPKTYTVEPYDRDRREGPIDYRDVDPRFA